MQNITSTSELKNAILLLESEQAIKKQLLKEQYNITAESLKPVNLLKSTLKNVVTPANLIDTVLGAVTGLATGYLSKKIVVGASGNIIRKLIGSVLQVNVSTAVAKHPEAIKSIGKFIFQHVFNKKKRALKNRERIASQTPNN
jgi:hypothetical protein